MSILLFGAAGQLGSALKDELEGARSGILPLTRRDADLRDTEALSALIAEARPSIIVNAAAYTQVDRAEAEPDLCEAVNHLAVAALARAAKESDALLVHYSTDYVFDGAKEGAYTEDDAPRPLNRYGLSKRRGEEAIMSSGARALILRTSWLYSEKSGFPARILAAAAARGHLSVPADQIGQPTTASSLARTTVQILDRYDGTSHGLYHCAGPSSITRLEWAEKVLKDAGLTIPVQSVTTAQTGAAAQRPLNSRLNCAKLAADYGVTISENS